MDNNGSNSNEMNEDELQAGKNYEVVKHGKWRLLSETDENGILHEASLLPLPMFVQTDMKGGDHESEMEQQSSKKEGEGVNVSDESEADINAEEVGESAVMHTSVSYRVEEEGEVEMEGDVGDITVPQSLSAYHTLTRSSSTLYDQGNLEIYIRPEDASGDSTYSPPTLPHSDVLLDVKCSKGTYVRAIGRDIGTHMGCGGHLVHLQRTGVYGIQLDQCWTMEELKEFAREFFLLNEKQGSGGGAKSKYGGGKKYGGRVYKPKFQPKF
uniref:tRNA pseudouridylate synthase B C-terminal domain-containing protein n=1 Tax=Palpitomonas bilix TaxID=652834 RepID=A0A7S3DL58_9EUKA